MLSHLLSRIAERSDAEAFRELFRAFAPRVKVYMMRRGAEPALAEDLAQETLLTVWRKAALYSSEKGTVATWIFTIARNLRIDRLRREIPWQEYPSTYGEEPSGEALPDEILVTHQRHERVRRALVVLPPDQLAVLMLSFTDGLSHTEIAEKLSLPLGTVKSRMRLAFQKVRDSLQDLD